ncbi:MAG: hypothetical protein BBJ57_07320 [Desulfobacterales bacterium PC51MH44]|nr:MAG: hypothetical protein BBJ57_07320 [Desulfobacterales bacterium PC51MH44]
MPGCNTQIEVSVPTKYHYKEIKSRCGATSPYGDPWLCDKCAKINEGRDWRREAEEAGECWGEDGY